LGMDERAGRGDDQIAVEAVCPRGRTGRCLDLVEERARVSRYDVRFALRRVCGRREPRPRIPAEVLRRDAAADLVEAAGREIHLRRRGEGPGERAGVLEEDGKGAGVA